MKSRAHTLVPLRIRGVFDNVSAALLLIVNEKCHIGIGSTSSDAIVHVGEAMSCIDGDKKGSLEVVGHVELSALVWVW